MHVEDMKDRHFDNDNEPDPFSAIGLQAALIVNKLRLQAQLAKIDKEDQKDAQRNTERNGSDEKDGGADREYIDQGLKKIAAFERRASEIDQRSARKGK